MKLVDLNNITEYITVPHCNCITITIETWGEMYKI